MAGKARPSLRKKTLYNVEHSNLSKTDKECIKAVFERFEEVKHGYWKECFEDWRKQIVGDECSACGFQHYGTSISHYHYCPNCGAKMDEKKVE
jgi:predicted Zn-ribbon and HTH transcriptional regulator